jgi:DNA helicase-2/ATP-dependent DNA helicase PcrA
MFDTEQQHVITTLDGAMLVTASAGSGKTGVLTERIRTLVEQRTGKILALTFTNKAADEMKERLNIPNLEERVFIGTIHSFCLDVLRSRIHVLGFTTMPHIFELEQDRLSIVRQVLEDNPPLQRFFLGKSEKEQQKLLRNCLDLISEQKRLLRVPQNDEIQTMSEERQILFREYEAILTSQNAMDYDDIVLNTHRIFTERPSIAELYRRIYRYICVDEAQDLNYAQYQLVRALCGNEHKNVLMVGDINQSLYGFNGSKPKYMTEDFKRDFHATEIRLTRNYRSSQKIVQAANSLIPNAMKDVAIALEGEFTVVSCEDEKTEAEWVRHTIQDLLQQKTHADIQGEITYESFAVLARNRYVLNHITEQLQKHEIPFHYKHGNALSTFDSDLIQAFDLGTRVLINPLDRIHAKRLCEILGVNIDSIDIQPSRSGLDVLRSFGHGNLPESIYTGLFRAWETLEKHQTDIPSALAVLKDSVQNNRTMLNGNIAETSVQQEYAAIEADICSWKTLWGKYCRSSSQEQRSLQHFRTVLALGQVSLHEEQQDGVALGTVHAFKGLAAEIVFVIGMNEGVFPDYRAIKKGGQALAEERNSLFVAFTRARRILYVSYPRHRFMPWNKEMPIAQEKSSLLTTFSEQIHEITEQEFC